MPKAQYRESLENITIEKQIPKKSSYWTSVVQMAYLLQPLYLSKVRKVDAGHGSLQTVNTITGLISSWSQVDSAVASKMHERPSVVAGQSPTKVETQDGVDS